MRQRPYQRLAAAVALVLAAGCATPRPERLNVIVFLSDALRAANLPMYGYRRDTTPHLKAVARSGVVFTNHLVHYPGTPVSVSQLFTGRLMPPLLLDYRYLAVPVHGVPADLLVLPQALQQLGYRTGIVTAHYWFSARTRLLAHFESQALLERTGDRSYAHFEELMPAIREFLARAETDDRPFFLYVHSMDTHGPNDVHAGYPTFSGPAGWPEEYDRYDAEIAYTDHWIHEVLEELARRRLSDRTIVAVTSDHGEEFGELGPEPWNRNHGLMVRRPLVHVPLIMRIPGDPAPGRRYVGLTRHIDLAPTLLRLAAPRASLAAYRVDGTDLSTELAEGGEGRETRRTTVAYSPRFWGVYEAGVELHYDQWEDRFSPLLRPVADARNYPRLETVDDPPTRERLERELAGEYQRRSAELRALPPNPDLATPVLIAVPTVVAPGSAAIPTFDDRPDDDRWHFAGPALECAPGEHPGPIALAMPWVPGRYRVAVALGGRSMRAGQANDFQLRLGGDGAPQVHIRGRDADAERWVDAGTHDLGGELRVDVSEPIGGVSVTGFRLERADGAGPPPQGDEERRQRLRALGYGD
jgi:arylsulfatase A-like enzyme